MQFPRNIKHPATYKSYVQLKKRHDISKLPARCIFGKEEKTAPSELRVLGFQSLWLNGTVAKLPGVGRFFQEDAPETVCTLIEQLFLIYSQTNNTFLEQSISWYEAA